jgi:Holliday junction resolvase-like predicted endonuclease
MVSQQVDPRRAFGQMGERLAAQHLQAKGYRIRRWCTTRTR